MRPYDYRCEKCGHTFEEDLKIADRKIPTESPCAQQIPQTNHMNFECGGEVKQIIVQASGFAYDNIRTKHSKKEPGWFKDKMTDMKKNIPGNTL